jgi:hypothetical protein
MMQNMRIMMIKRLIMQQQIECAYRALPWAERIEILRLRCLDRKAPAADGRILLQNRSDFTDVVDAHSLADSEPVSSWQRRAGLRTRARLEALPFVVDDYEILAGRPDYDRMAVTPDKLVWARQYLAPLVRPGGQTGHCALDLEPLLSGGIRGIVQAIEIRLAIATGDEADTLLSFLDVLDGLSILIHHAGEAAAAAAAMAPDWRCAEPGSARIGPGPFAKPSSCSGLSTWLSNMATTPVWSARDGWTGFSGLSMKQIALPDGLIGMRPSC